MSVYYICKVRSSNRNHHKKKKTIFYRHRYSIWLYKLYQNWIGAKFRKSEILEIGAKNKPLIQWNLKIQSHSIKLVRFFFQV